MNRPVLSANCLSGIRLYVYGDEPRVPEIVEEMGERPARHFRIDYASGDLAETEWALPCSTAHRLWVLK